MARQNKWDSKHQKDLERYARQIDAIYQSAVREAASIGATIPNFSPDKPFSFADYPSTRVRVQKLIDGLKNGVQTVILNGVDSEWTLANNKNNELCNVVFGDNVKNLSTEQERRYYRSNGKACDAFKTRKMAGLGLSDFVWKYTDQFKSEIEMGLDLGLRDGLSADEISRELRSYLKYPDKLFRRVRDTHGQLHLSQAAKAFHPGQGVYRSSYKNARRLAATETNMAYRTSDYVRWQQLDFVVGIRIVLSNNHTLLGADGKPHKFEDICDELSAPLDFTPEEKRGLYPKDFKFVGWHPQCRCHAISILKTPEEMEADNGRIMNGEELNGESVNRVDDVPQQFKQWIDENTNRIDDSRTKGTLPYFIKDNESKQWFNSVMASRYNDDYIASMRDNGIGFSDKTAQLLAGSHSFNRIDILKLNDDIQGTFAKHGIERLNLRIQTNDKRLSLTWTGNGVELKRSFYIDGEGRKVVDHELFVLPKELQGRGISKQVLGSLYEQYKVAGVQRIELFANIDVGGYAWARYGFCTKNRNEALSAIQFSALTHKQEERIVAIIDEHFNSSSAPFQMNKIASLTYGKKALLGSYWEGVLDLTDAQQSNVYVKYLRR